MKIKRSHLEEKYNINEEKSWELRGIMARKKKHKGR